MSAIKYYQNGGKRTRRGIDQWDRVRISGFFPAAPGHLLTTSQQSRTTHNRVDS